MDNLQPDDIITGVRLRKKQSEPISCPVCGVTVRPTEMEYHYSVEVDRLHKVYSGVGGANKRKSTSVTPLNKHQVAGCSAATTSTSSTASDTAGVPQEPIDPKECWNTYQRIKNNRQTRLKVKYKIRFKQILFLIYYLCRSNPENENLMSQYVQCAVKL